MGAIAFALFFFVALFVDTNPVRAAKINFKGEACLFGTWLWVHARRLFMS